MNQPSDFAPGDDARGALLRRAAHDEAPPPAVRARAVALRSGLAAVTGALLRRVAALVRSEAGAAPFAPAFGVRGGALSARQWLFRADECEIDLRVAPRGERWSVAGQVFGALQAERVELAGAEHRASAVLGATREFAFDDLAAGSYSLALQGGEVEVVIPQFDVGPA